MSRPPPDAVPTSARMLAASQSYDAYRPATSPVALNAATVGNTGGNPESGLYFELRQQGQAFDPLRWVNLR